MSKVNLNAQGFDFFAPTEAVIYHLWSRQYRHTFQEVDCRLDVSTCPAAVALHHNAAFELELMFQVKDDLKHERRSQSQAKVSWFMN